MKTFIAALFAVSLTACADSPSATTTSSVPVGNPSYSLYSTNRYANSPVNSPLRRMTTAQLQERRLALYKTMPQGETRRGQPYYIYHGSPLPQQDEILAIEGELKRRFDTGDKTAELQRPIPGFQHPG
jgi:hypothetical protein